MINAMVWMNVGAALALLLVRLKYGKPPKWRTFALHNPGTRRYVLTCELSKEAQENLWRESGKSFRLVMSQWTKHLSDTPDQHIVYKVEMTLEPTCAVEIVRPLAELE